MSTVVNGATSIRQLDGSGYDLFYRDYVIAADTVRLVNINRSPTPEEKIIAERLYELAKGAYIEQSSKADFRTDWIRNPIQSNSESFAKQLKTSSVNAVRNIRSDLSKQKQQRNEDKRRKEQLKQNTKQRFDGLLATIAQEAINLAQQQINKLLPSEYQLDIGVDFSGGDIAFTGLSVGDIVYNASENTINYSGEVYTTLAQQGLDIVNEQLPDFLPIRLTSKDIGLGPISFDLDDLRNNPNQKFDLSNSVSVQNVAGDIAVFLGEQVYTVGKVAASSAISKGLDSLNRLLPSGLQAEINPTEGTFGIGPVSFNPLTGDFNFDAAGATQLITNQLESRVFNQLPAPLANISRALWEAVDITSIFRPDPSNFEPTDSIIVSQDKNNRLVPGTPNFVVPNINGPYTGDTLQLNSQ